LNGYKNIEVQGFLKPILWSSDLKRGRRNRFEIEVRAGEMDAVLAIVSLLVNLK